MCSLEGARVPVAALAAANASTWHVAGHSHNTRCWPTGSRRCNSFAPGEVVLVAGGGVGSRKAFAAGLEPLRVQALLLLRQPAHCKDPDQTLGQHVTGTASYHAYTQRACRHKALIDMGHPRACQGALTCTAAPRGLRP